MAANAQPTAPQAPPAPAPKKKTMMYVAIAVVVVVVVAAVAVVALMNNGGGNNGLASAWDPQQGQYLDYSISGHVGSGDESMAFTGSMHMLVKSVDANNVTMNITVTMTVDTGYGTVTNTTYMDQTIDKNNATFAYFSSAEMPQGVTPVTLPDVSMSTPWGTQMCKHMQVTAEGVSIDVYVYQSVMVKMSMTLPADLGDMSMDATLTSAHI